MRDLQLFQFQIGALRMERAAAAGESLDDNKL
jgi:hypothetical protein